MQFLRKLCPTALELVPGVYLGTCVETAFLLSYPRAKLEHPGKRIWIEVGVDHTRLHASDDIIYDPIGDVIRAEYIREGVVPLEWTNSEVIEEEDFSEWWTVNILGGEYHPSADFIADLYE